MLELLWLLRSILDLDSPIQLGRERLLGLLLVLFVSSALEEARQAPKKISRSPRRKAAAELRRGFGWCLEKRSGRGVF